MGGVCSRNDEAGAPSSDDARIESVDMKPKKLDVPATGLGQIYLANIKKTADLPHMDRNPEVDGTAPVFAHLDDLKEKYGSNDEVMRMMRNKVKVCGKCGKPCAYTLADCNACGTTLKDIPLGYSDNIFTCFIFGVGKGKFPYQISLRNQSPEFLCFDDVLSMSVCHLNVIPADVYCPDLRYLFKDPKRGLELINGLFNFGATTALSSFWSNPEFRKKYLNNTPKPASPDELYPYVLCGMNFPPSQFQLHLQFIHAPMLPFHYATAREENHFHYRRFFPLEYLVKALSLGDKVKMNVTDDTSIDEILSMVEKQGVNYDEVQIALLRRCRKIQEQFSPWQEDDFEDYVMAGNKVLSIESFGYKPDADPKKIQAADTQALQNYGRPYNAEGKPTGTYYKFTKTPTDLKLFGGP